MFVNIKDLTMLEDLLKVHWKMLLFKALEFELENDVINFCKNSVSELPEVDDFENSSKKINKNQRIFVNSKWTKFK